MERNDNIMIKPSIVVMAAGMGSRYGGLKQVDCIGPFGETIIDYSIFDAIKAGFGKVIFIISKEIEDTFKERIGDRIARSVPVKYVIQSVDNVPKGFSPPVKRVKPWGTGHAIYCCRNIINDPFAVINADDFYCAEAYGQLAEFLSHTCDDERYHYCMAGYLVGNTLTENGYVSRGICNISGGFLSGVTERTHIRCVQDKIVYYEDGGKSIEIEPDSVVSMNMWGFTPSIFDELESCFINFLKREETLLEKEEFYLPFLVNELIREGKADVKVLTTGAKWYGVTYREDKEAVKSAVIDMIKKGTYPERLYNDELRF